MALIRRPRSAGHLAVSWYNLSLQLMAGVAN